MTDAGRSTAEEAPTANRETANAAEPTGETDAPPADPTPGTLAVVCGLPGVGKTTVARRVADHLDAEILRTDVIRKELFPDPEYTDEETAAVYAELLDRATDAVAGGTSVVLDATFADDAFRADARAVAAEHAKDFHLIKVECDEAVVERRIRRRDGISDADFDVHLHFREIFDPVESDHLVVDNSGDEATTFDQVDVHF